jgi:hypothetical protein
MTTEKSTKLSLNACRGLAYRYFLREGWLPPGTTEDNWDGLRMDQMMFDDPPLPSDPHFQKRRASLDLMALFFVLGHELEDPFDELSDDKLTLSDFAEWCSEHNQ